MGAPQYEQAGADIGGTGTTNTIPRWTGPSTLGDSVLTQSGTTIYQTGSVNGAVAFNVTNQNTGASAYSAVEIDSAGASWRLKSIRTAGMFAIERNGVVAVQIDNVLNVGIGTASPGRKLEISASAPLRMGTGGEYFEFLQYTPGTWAWLSSAGQYVASWKTSGGMGFGGIVAPASNTVDVSTAGWGLKLPATPGNADAQTLDCYAEGTWTPTLNSFTTSGTVTASGKVTRWGRLAIVELTITTGAASSATCTALTSNVTGFSTAPPSDTFNVFATGGVSGTLTVVNAAMVSGGTIYPAAFTLAANQTIKFVFSYTV